MQCTETAVKWSIYIIHHTNTWILHSFLCNVQKQQRSDLYIDFLTWILHSVCAMYRNSREVIYIDFLTWIPHYVCAMCRNSSEVIYIDFLTRTHEYFIQFVQCTETAVKWSIYIIPHTNTWILHSVCAMYRNSSEVIYIYISSHEHMNTTLFNLCNVQKQQWSDLYIITHTNTWILHSFLCNVQKQQRSYLYIDFLTCILHSVCAMYRNSLEVIYIDFLTWIPHYVCAMCRNSSEVIYI